MTVEGHKHTIYNGSFEHAVDPKRRVQVPAAWRPASPETEFTVIVWPKSAQGTCLRVLPPHQMVKLMAELDAMPNSDPNKVVLKRFIGSKSIQIPLDGAGRICIPEPMAAEAGIEKKVTMVGLLDRFEIWSTDRFSAVATSDNVMAAEAFKMME